jgi:hypothetical protein
MVGWPGNLEANVQQIYYVTGCFIVEPGALQEPVIIMHLEFGGKCGIN